MELWSKKSWTHYFKMAGIKKKVIRKLVTHDGSFHADDIFACATLFLMLEKNREQPEIIRTRDEEIISSADYVFDVGGIYDEKNNRFDHHQVEGAGKRVADGERVSIEYSSFGLVWKKFGLDLSGSQKVAEFVDRRIAVPVDADDNGFSLFEKKYELSPLLIQNFFSLMRPTWQESAEDYDKNFLKAVKVAKEVLLRAIAHGLARVEADEILTKVYQNTEDKRIIVLDRYYPFSETLDDLPLPIFVLYPKENQKEWCVKAVSQKGQEFKNRKDFPKAWAGLRDEELQKITGVEDAVFCHRALFLAVAKSQAGAVALAQKALEAS